MQHAVDKRACSWAHRITASFGGDLGFEAVGLHACHVGEHIYSSSFHHEFIVLAGLMYTGS